MSLSKLTKGWVADRLPKRPTDANKGTFGKVLVVAGSHNYPGAAYLACAASYRVGVGLVALATTTDVEVIVSRKLPEVTFFSKKEIYAKLSDIDVLLLGPGVGQDEQTKSLVKKVIKKQLRCAVIDGDGLNILSKINDWWNDLKMKVVLTPHPGEMARLTGLSVNEVQSSREENAKLFAKRWRQVVVLKGANTVIASPEGKIVISPFANPVLATAGTGDILSGVIAGFVAQGLDSFDAACCGVYVHGLAAEEIKEKIGDAGLLASDLLPILPRVINFLKKGKSKN